MNWQCPVCFEKLGKKAGLVPMTSVECRPIGHMICMVCVEQLGSNPKCPLCTTKTQFIPLPALIDEDADPLAAEALAASQARKKPKVQETPPAASASSDAPVTQVVASDSLQPFVAKSTYWFQKPAWNRTKLMIWEQPEDAACPVQSAEVLFHLQRMLEEFAASKLPGTDLKLSISSIDMYRECYRFVDRSMPLHIATSGARSDFFSAMISRRRNRRTGEYE